MIISLGGPLPARSSSLPGVQGKRAASRCRASAVSFIPAWPCSRWGLPGRGITTNAGGLLPMQNLAVLLRRTAFAILPTVSPLPQTGRFVSVARSGRLLHPGCYPASRSSECGLSSTRLNAWPRSSDQPEGIYLTLKVDKSQTRVRVDRLGGPVLPNGPPFSHTQTKEPVAG